MGQGAGAARLPDGGGAPNGAAEEPPLPDEIAALVRSFDALGTAWRVAPSADVLNLPGIGLSVPDLVFERSGTKVYLEVMGYWSRDAVWRRVELVEKGLGARIVFAASARLRVSEKALATDLPGALYVYKGAMNARAVAEHVERLAARTLGQPQAAESSGRTSAPTSTS